MDKTKVELFQKNKDFLVCVDSDGCAMNTMEVKHRKSFGPEMIKEWGLQEREEEILELWNHLNLYADTRGINRFKGLALLFQKLAERGIEIPGREELKEWSDHTPQLSNDALKKQLDKTGSEIFKKTYRWSLAVNESIAALPIDEGAPFANVKETLQLISQKANVSIVSSANGQAIDKEWSHFGLTPFVDVMLGQEAGTKSICIEKLCAKGFQKDHALMVGDALGDLQAARDNGVMFYPIIAGEEGASWEKLQKEAFPKFLDGSYAGAYEKSLEDAFRARLSK